MHGGANTRYAWWRGRAPRGVHGDEAANVYPTMDYGGLRVPRHRSWRGTYELRCNAWNDPTSVWLCLLPPKNSKVFKIPHYIESLNVCMEY